MGSILALFRPSGPLCFPVRQGAFSVSGGIAAAATGAAGGFYILLYKQWCNNWSKTINPPTPADARGSASGQRGCPTPTTTLLWKLFDCSTTTAAVGAATSTSAGSSRTTATTTTITTTTTTSEPWCFSCRELIFSTLFSCEQPQAIESLEKGCFSRISDGTLGPFLAWFWN